MRYRNLLSTGNIDTEVILDSHKNTLIVGENGSGKSTVLEAISFALYGKSIRSISKGQLINSIIQRGLMTEIEFAVGPKNYFVRRGMKPNVFEIHANGKLINQDAASRDYQDVLENQILKLNHKSFSQIVTLSVSSFTPFMQLPAAGRREVVEDLLDIQVFSAMNVLLKDKITANKTNIATAEAAIALAESKIEMHARHVEELNANHEEAIGNKKEQIKKYAQEIVILNGMVTDCSQEISRINEVMEQFKSIQTRLSKVQSNHVLVEVKKRKIASSIDFLRENDTCPTCQQMLDGGYKDDQIAKKSLLLDEAQKAILQLEETISGLQSGLIDLPKEKEQLRVVNTSLTEHNAKIMANGRFVATLRKEVKALEEKIAKSKDDDARLDDLQAELDDAMRRKEELVTEREVLNMAAQLLKDGGIKARIIKQYIPIINRLINSYLAKLEFFIEFSLDEEFKETIKSRFRDEFSYQSFSQGERLRLDLALLFAWRAVAKIRNSSSANLIFFDEILDSSLDASGIDDFLTIINNLTSDQNCVIISHRGDAIIDRFDRVLRFQKIRNFSRMVA